MKPVFLKPSQIDRSKWDSAASSFGGGNACFQSWYLDAVSKEWNALILGDYNYIMPLPTKTKGFFRIAYQPFFSRQLGIIGEEPINETLIQLFLDALPKTYGQFMIGFPELNSIQIPNYSYHTYPYQVLGLDRSAEELRSGYSENASRILKKLEKSSVTYRDVEAKVVADLFAEETSGKIDHIGPDDIQRLQRLFEAAINTNSGRAVGAFTENGELLATGFFVIYGDTVNYLKGASTEAGRANGAMYGLMDHMITSYSSSHSVFDFGGSKIPSIAGFFKKFGAIDRHYSLLQKDQPFLIHLSKQLYHKLSR